MSWVTSDAHTIPPINRIANQHRAYAPPPGLCICVGRIRAGHDSGCDTLRAYAGHDGSTDERSPHTSPVHVVRCRPSHGQPRWSMRAVRNNRAGHARYRAGTIRRLLGVAGNQVSPAQPTFWSFPARLPNGAIPTGQADPAGPLARHHPGPAQSDRAIDHAPPRPPQAAHLGTRAARSG